jgi:hypothetical protein
MTVYGDQLSAYGNAQTVEIPPDLITSPYGGIKNTNDATAKNPLGTLYRYKGNLYRYVKMYTGQGTVAAAAYGVVHWYALDPTAGTFTVTSDQTDALAGINSVAGVIGTTAVTNAYYTWIQVAGLVTAFVAGSTAVGDIMIGYATDLYFNRIAADSTITSVPFGVALTAVSSNKSSVILCSGVLKCF